MKLITILARNGDKTFFNCRAERFKNSFFSYTIEAWYTLDLTSINSKSLEVFKSKLLPFIRPVQRSVLLTRLPLILSHRFRENFKDCINPMCPCSLDVEKWEHFFLHCLHYLTFRSGLMNKVNQID